MAEAIYAGDGGYFKTCTKCEELKPLFDFNRKSRNSDGRRAECRECQGSSNRDYARNNPEKIRDKTRAYRVANPEIARAASRRAAKKARENGYAAEYERANKDRLSKKRREWWDRNPHKRKEYNERYYSSAKGKLSSAIRAAVRSEIINGSKGGRITFNLLGYTPDELMAHLERQFTEGMTWGNYGRGGWHVDHRIPLSAFNYETPDDIDFKRAWALDNLQPMWEFDNLSKGSRLPPGGFQPSFALGV